MTEARNFQCLHPFDLIFCVFKEAVHLLTKKAAMQREKEWKSGVGREIVWEKIRLGFT